MGGLHRQLRRVRTWARWADAGGTVEVGALHTNGGANGRPSRESDGDCLGALSDNVDYDRILDTLEFAPATIGLSLLRPRRSKLSPHYR